MLHVDDVMHFESDTQGTRVAADDCDGLIRSRLKGAVLDSVPSGNFLQTHCSTVVDRRFVRDLHRKSDQVGLELKQRFERLAGRLSPATVRPENDSVITAHLRGIDSSSSYAFRVEPPRILRRLLRLRMEPT
jgi:hypothetical protein